MSENLLTSIEEATMETTTDKMMAQFDKEKEEHREACLRAIELLKSKAIAFTESSQKAEESLAKGDYFGALITATLPYVLFSFQMGALHKKTMQTLEELGKIEERKKAFQDGVAAAGVGA